MVGEGADGAGEAPARAADEGGDAVLGAEKVEEGRGAAAIGGVGLAQLYRQVESLPAREAMQSASQPPL